MDISRAKIAISTHYLIYGAPQALRDFLTERKAGVLLYIAHPLGEGKDKTYWEGFEKGRLMRKGTWRIRTGIGLVNHVLESIYTIARTIVSGRRYDLFVGVDNLNAFCGIILRELGVAKTVVFYTIDYVPNRFDNRLLNEAYHWLDAYCVRNSDEVWNVSERIAKAREEYRGMSRRRYSHQKVVPIGVWLDRVKVLPFEKVRKHRLLFMGHLLKKQGVQYVLDAVPAIVRKIPDFEFLIVGGGEYEGELKERAKRLGIEGHVMFTGWVKERKKIDLLMADSAVAIAMYQKFDEKGNVSFTYFADPTKIKDYLSAGLPVIMTDVPHNAREIESKGCGRVIRLDRRDIASAVISLMRDEKALRGCRGNARKYALLFDWNVIFQKAFKGLK